MTFSAFIVHSSDPTGLLIWCAIGFFGGLGLFVYGFRLLLRRRLILDTPFSKIRSASMGMVEVSGLAVGPYTMIAPITARPCYYYRTLVWEWKQSGKNKEWVKVAGECMHLPFFLDDNTGRVLVDPRGADLDLHRDFQQEFSDSFFTTKEPVPGNVRSFLARHGVSTNNKIRVEEYCIKPKNSLFILGTLAENPGLEVSARPIRDAEPITSWSSKGGSLSISITIGRSGRDFDTGSPLSQMSVGRETAELIRLPSDAGPAKTTEVTQQQKIAAALLKAGISNPAAWSVAGITPAVAEVPVATDASSSVGDSRASSQDHEFELHPPVVLMTGTSNKTFLISWRSQQEVARSLGWKCTLMIWVGPVLALLSLYVFLSVKQLL